ncbi:hypothetical protein [Bradyrhizobium liaoningense]
MWSELASLSGAGAEDIMLAQLEPDMRGRHQNRRQAPEQDEEHARNAAPMPATQQDDDDQDACDDKGDISGATQHEQIGIILVHSRECGERRGQPEQDEAEAIEELHDAAHAIGAMLRNYQSG